MPGSWWRGAAGGGGDYLSDPVPPSVVGDL